MAAEPTNTEQALTPGTNQLTGRYRYDLTTQEWWWSNETFQIHGFEPGEVVPTMTLVLAHKHPEDRTRVSRMFQGAAVTGEPFSSVHRIMDARGRERTLTVVGEGLRDPDTSQVRELVGYFVDVTTAVEAQAGKAASASIRASSATRAPIEQAKGIVAFALGVDIEEAFERLRRTSNDTNVAVRDVARRIIGLAPAGGSAADVAEALRASAPGASRH